MSTARSWLLAAGALLAAVVAAPSAAQAGAGQGVGYRLTGEPGSTLTSGFIRLPATPGATVDASFVAVNSTPNTVQVAFYGADGDTTRNTGAVYGSSDAADTGAWLTPSRKSATMPPNSELTIDVSVRVPAGASTGDHVGAVIMEQQEGASSATVKQVVRYGVPILVDVGAGGGPQIEMGRARLERIVGTELVAAVLPMRNSGTRICRPVVTANVAGGNGPPLTVERQLDEVLPGDRILYPLRLADTMPGGTYLVRADVTGCGNPASTSSSATLESSDKGAGSETPAPTSPNVVDGEVTPVPLKKDRRRRGDGSGGGGAATKARPRDATPAPPSLSRGSDDDRAAVPVQPKKPTGRSWLRRTGDAIVDSAPKVLEKASVPLGASALVGLLFLFQNALDRRDPKLAGAPRERDDALRFDPNPLQTGG